MARSASRTSTARATSACVTRAGEAPVAQPVAQAGRPVEQLDAVLAVQRVDEVLDEAQVVRGRRTVARLRTSGDEVLAEHLTAVYDSHR